jgi:hypothetical protein
VFCYHTPELRSTILSPSSLERLLGHSRVSGTSLKKDHQHGVFAFIVHNTLRRSENIHLDGILSHGLCYTAPLILPRFPGSHLPSVSCPTHDDPAHIHSLLHPSDSSDTSSSVVLEFRIHKLHTRAERLLWHQRLGHPSDSYLYNAHQHIKGVPRFAHQDSVLDQCPTCIETKMKKRDTSATASTRSATTPWQGLSIDFAFTGQRSKNKARADTYKGINGKSCYILIADHATSQLDGAPQISKGAPLSWLQTGSSVTLLVSLTSMFFSTKAVSYTTTPKSVLSLSALAMKSNQPAPTVYIRTALSSAPIRRLEMLSGPCSMVPTST